MSNNKLHRNRISNLMIWFYRCVSPSSKHGAFWSLLGLDCSLPGPPEALATSRLCQRQQKNWRAKGEINRLRTDNLSQTSQNNTLRLQMAELRDENGLTTRQELKVRRGKKEEKLGRACGLIETPFDGIPAGSGLRRDDRAVFKINRDDSGTALLSCQWSGDHFVSSLQGLGGAVWHHHLPHGLPPWTPTVDAGHVVYAGKNWAKTQTGRLKFVIHQAFLYVFRQ